MKVSIIVPVYNVRNYLQKCLDSITSQTLKDIEVIIVDDGSTDGSAAFVDAYASNYDVIKVIHKENGGLMSAWTTGVKASKGDYIGFVDSDDYILPQMYENLYAFAHENQADLVISNYLINGNQNDGQYIQQGLYEGEVLKTLVTEHLFPSTTNTCPISMGRTSKLFRRKILFDNLHYCSSLSRTFEDRYIVPAVVLSCQRIYVTTQAYYCWMLREGSNHGMYKEHLLEDIKRVYDIHHQVVMDKCPSLEQKWEEEYLDFIRLYVDRNIIRVKNFKTKVKSAKVLVGDQLTKDRLDKYGHLFKNKLGMAVMFAYRFRCPFSLALMCCFVKANG